MLKVQRVCEMNPVTFYCCYNGLEFSDGEDKVIVSLSDEQYLRLAKELQDKATRIRKSQLEKLEKLQDELASTDD